MIDESDIDEMHPAGAWEANGFGELDMTEENDIEAKFVRVQASFDELADALAIRLRTIVGKVAEGDTLEAVRLLEGVIEAVEVFAGPGDAEEEEEEEEE